jgi:hypothetical protein
MTLRRANGMSSEEWGHYIRRKLDDPDWRHLRVDK